MYLYVCACVLFVLIITLHVWDVFKAKQSVCMYVCLFLCVFTAVQGQDSSAGAKGERLRSIFRF